MSELLNSTWQGYIKDNGIEPISKLEQACWSPWLAASPESLAGRAEVFPEGQLCVYSGLGLLATLSVNKIKWDGQPDALPTWDEVAGDPTTYEKTFANDGNTLCLMSMNVSEQGRSQQLPRLLINALLSYAQSTGIKHVIGSFRPSAYNRAVISAIQQGNQPPNFKDYCMATNTEGYPVDPWLRSLTKNGMQPIAVDSKAMHIPISKEEFEAVQQPDWKKININGNEVWWCNETGFFYPQPDGSYVYTESNLWGSLNEE